MQSYCLCFPSKWKVNYTKEFRELQGKKTSVVDDPETARVKKNTQNQSLAQYHGLQDQRNMENYQREREAENLAGTNRQGKPQHIVAVEFSLDSDPKLKMLDLL